MNDEMGLFQGTPFIINVGVEDFGVALEEQGVQVVYVQWTPPAGGDQEMLDLLDEFL